MEDRIKQLEWALLKLFQDFATDEPHVACRYEDRVREVLGGVDPFEVGAES